MSNERPLDLLIRCDGTVLHRRTNGAPTWQAWDYDRDRRQLVVGPDGVPALSGEPAPTITFRRKCKLDSGRWVYEETP